MIEAKIIRFANHFKLGCPGELFLDGTQYGSTIERPWIPIEEGKGGKPFASCVPASEYHLIKYESQRFGECFILSSVENEVFPFKDDMLHDKQRYKCLFAHKGSYVRNFVGCIGLGKEYRLMGIEMGISNTRATCEKIMNLFYKEDITKLKIEWKNHAVK